MCANIISTAWEEEEEEEKNTTVWILNEKNKEWIHKKKKCHLTFIIQRANKQRSVCAINKQDQTILARLLSLGAVNKYILLVDVLNLIPIMCINVSNRII